MMTIRTVCVAAAILAIGGSAVPATAASQWCTGTLSASWTNKLGDVLVESSWRQSHTQICNIRYEWKGVPADTCIAWVAKLDAAVAMNKRVTIYYGEAPSCNLLPGYEQSPAPYYVMLLAS